MDDIDADGFDEMLPGTFASSNYNDEPFVYSDTSSWFMVFDHDLKFMFPPVEFPSPTGGVGIFPLKAPDGSVNILGSANYGSLNHKMRKYFISDINGKVLRKGPRKLMIHILGLD